MKTKFYLIAILLIGITHTNAQQVIVTDDASYTTPANGAMLDVKSTSKGFMMPRVALNSITDVSTIASPSAGLMVYNNGAGALKDKGLYYWNDTIWVKQLTGGTSSTASYLKIAGDGTVRLVGDATSYDDLKVDGARVQNSGVTAPFWGIFAGGLYANQFEDAKVQSVYFNVQMPHNWKEGSDIMPHVHWCGMTAPLTNKVVWKLEYQWVNIGGNFSSSTNTTLSASTVLTNTNINPDNSLAQLEHTITPLGTITGTGQKFSSVLICRLYRQGDDVVDNFTNNAVLLSIDFHFQIDSFGTNNEYAKD